MIDAIVEIINSISETHKIFSIEFSISENVVNLKKCRISAILSDNGQNFDEAFFKTMERYIDKINGHVLLYTIPNTNEEIDIRYRGKQQESALNKIYHYRFTKEEKGKVPIQKALNDLFGVRLIVNTELDYHELKKQIENSDLLKATLHRPYVREDDEYKAIHIYINNGNNRYFSWEVQIWRSQDEKKNELSHASHKSKREYVDFASKYKANSSRKEE
ncbi:MAG: hypothetical protein ACRDCC_00280 [Culicoidibacterales bacterium]